MGPGTRIAAFLTARGIKPTPGCGCYKLATEMDQAGSEAILEDLDVWVTKMHASSQQWIKQKVGRWAPVSVPRWAIRELIKAACE